MNYRLRFASIADADHVDHFLSRSDIQEVQDMGLDPNGIAARSYQTTVDSGGLCYALEVEGRVVAVLGVSVTGFSGTPWLLGVEGGEWRKLLVTSEARTLVEAWLQAFKMLVNFVSKDNTRSTRFLKFLGFSLSATMHPNILIFSKGTPHV